MPREVQHVDKRFPAGGVDLSYGFGSQFVRQLDTGPIATCRDARNVRGYDVPTTRFRGASRPGLSKLIPLQVAGLEWVTSMLEVLVGTGFSPPSGVAVQNSQSGRVVLLVAVAQGVVYSCTPGDTTWTAATNATANTPALNFDGIMYSASNLQKLWIVDGTNAVYFDPVTNTVYPWTATAGTFPIDVEENLPRLICTWRGRTVLAGLPKDPQDWFMSAVNQPQNWSYAPVSPSSTDAIAGQNAPQGLVGDVITCLYPYNDDVLIMGGDHSITMFRGDPAAGGQIDLITDSIGMAWGRPICRDPDGTVYFFSNRTGIFSLIPGQKPQRISQGIEQLLLDINTGTNIVTMAWNDRFQGFHAFVTPLVVPGATQHFFWEKRTQAWWVDQFADTGMDPLCVAVFDGNGPDDRVTVLGPWDGYVRKLDHTVFQDDGEDIESFVVIGPIDTMNLDDMTLHDLQAILGETSGEVTYEVFTGRTAEIALSNPVVSAGVWQPGRNNLSLVRAAGHAIYVKLSSSDAWAMESIRARIATNGKIRQRAG